MVVTRKMKKDVRDHVFKEVLGLEDDSFLHLACDNDGQDDMAKLLSLIPSEIDDLTYIEPITKKKTLLNKGDRGLVHALQAIQYKRQIDGNEIDASWSNITQDEFDQFRVSVSYISTRKGLPDPKAPKPPVVAAAPPPIRPRDNLYEFKRGIRRDANAFTPLKEDKQWDAWHRSTVAQARAQDLSDVLDPNFHPITNEARDVFEEKQKFMYAVFEKILLTDKGKAIVRQYSTHFDAQSVHRDICAYARSSTRSAIEASDLMTYITSTRYGDGAWKGTAHGYILHWQDQVRQYEQLIPVTGHFSNIMKRAMLENAVGASQELRAVKSQAAQHKTQNGGIDLTYDQYTTLLLSAAQEFDGSLLRSLKPTPSSGRRSVYHTEVIDEQQEFFDANHNIDSYCNDVLEINAAFGFRGPSLTGDQWARLPKDAQIKWDEFAREHKAIILEP